MNDILQLLVDYCNRSGATVMRFSLDKECAVVEKAIGGVTTVLYDRNNEIWI